MDKRSYGRIDWFRLAAALLVIAIHTAPFSDMNPKLDTVLTYGLGRVAVPFFLMTTGYFVIAPYWSQGFSDGRRYRRFLKKTLLLYGGAVLLYVPVMWYAGKFPSDLPEFLKMLVFDGTFYHLWYFPALLMGCVLCVWLLQRGSLRSTAAMVSLLYAAGLLGDSYYGLVSKIPVLEAVYQEIFRISSYTRNGIFYAPVFLFLGVLAAAGKCQCSAGAERTGQILSTGLMLAESYVTDLLGWQRHSSMYAALPLVMYFLYPVLLRGEGRAPSFLRSGTAFLYVIHPAAIILVRGIAQALGLKEVLADHSMIHYVSVVLLSMVMMIYYLYAVRLIGWFRRRTACRYRERGRKHV